MLARELRRLVEEVRSLRLGRRLLRGEELLQPPNLSACEIQVRVRDRL